MPNLQKGALLGFVLIWQRNRKGPNLFPPIPGESSLVSYHRYIQKTFRIMHGFTLHLVIVFPKDTDYLQGFAAPPIPLTGAPTGYPVQLVKQGIPDKNR